MEDFDVKLDESETQHHGSSSINSEVCYVPNVMKVYTCSKECEKIVRVLKPDSKQPKRRQGITRESCNARLAVLKSGDKFKVSIFKEVRNHTFSSPGKVQLLPSHWHVSSTQKALAQTFNNAGGIQNIGYTKQDIRNARRDARKVTDGHDADMLNEHFLAQKERNLYFTYTIEIYDENQISHIFWANTTSREAYKYFGDIVVFDITYQTNSQYYESFRECIWDLDGPEEFGCRWAALIERSELHENKRLQTMFNKRDSSIGRLYGKDELWESMKYGSTVKVDDEFKTISEVERRVFDGGKGTQRQNKDSEKAMPDRVRLIVDYKVSDVSSYSCKNFEKQYTDFLSKYILKRWTKGAKCLNLMEGSGVNIEDIGDRGLLFRCNDLYEVLARVVDGAVLSVEGTEILREDLLTSERKINSLSIGEGSNNLGVPSNCPLISSTPVLLEPNQVRAKGCGKRIKGGKEKAREQNLKKCNECNQWGLSHDKRNCPTLMNMVHR
ncbi:hypothetical protein L1049_019702 [Liquidambar formosana]|uniref:Protein FAR1-RELATED SEQUENCE n=1 Tax=Liquidambar formosana TaxID=63359 RepID=A0AAP0SBR0_LIQFO